MHELIISTNLTRKEKYKQLIPQIEAVIASEKDIIANLANIAAILKESMGFFWVGFYRVIQSELVLGPFQGPLACTRIPFGKGVCGACVRQATTIIVPNVDEFPGHIACSSLSKSEIVVPLIQEQQVKLILDVDSVELDDFDESDQYYLEKIMDIISLQHSELLF